MAHKFEVMLDIPQFSTAVFLSVNVDKLTNKRIPINNTELVISSALM